MQDSLPTPLTDDRFPFLRYRPANPNAKNKEADDYKAKIVSNDAELDIFDVPDNTFLKDAKLNLNDIQPFVEYTKGVGMLDLEWVGVDGGEAKGDGTDIIVAIGLKNRGRYYIGCNKNKTEKELIIWFFNQLERLDYIHTLAAHSGYGFFRKGEEVLVDFGMLWKRCQVHGIEKLCPWKRATGKWSTHRWGNAIVNGQPLEVPAWECKKYQLIDTYTQTALYDFLVSKLTDYSLKMAPVQFGIKEENARKHDIGADVHKYWKEGDTQTISDYLKEDLDDVELLWNYLLPQKYFMKSYMDWDLKRITTTGTGSWWLQFYKKQTGSEIPRIDKCGYTGALTYYKAGIYKRCCKYDFSGLYPSIMLTYLISMKWDKDYFLLKALKFLITYRKSIKKTQAFIDYDNGIETPEGIDAYGQQLTAKILANSLYGALALVDPYAAAAVTSYGRQLVRFMIEWLNKKGLEVHGCDTDGVIASFKEDKFKTDEERSAAFKKFEQELNDVLPGETKVEYEEYIPMVYIPPNDDNKAKTILADKLNSMECYEVDPANLDPGLSKNYIYFVKKGDKCKKVYKGKFKKRGKSWLQAGFVMDFVEKMFYEGDEAAKDFAEEIRNRIAEGKLDTQKVRETKLVSKSQKALPLYGFENSQKYTLHYTPAGETIKRRHEWKLIMPTDDETRPYDSDHYWGEFNEKILPQLFIELPPILEEDENGKLVEKKPMRTELSKDPETVERILIKNGLF